METDRRAAISKEPIKAESYSKATNTIDFYFWQQLQFVFKIGN